MMKVLNAIYRNVMSLFFVRYLLWLCEISQNWHIVPVQFCVYLNKVQSSCSRSGVFDSYMQKK